MSAILDLLILLSGLSYVSLAPFTKVEESFNLHATHDVLMYGIEPSTLHKKYDHFAFPGAVPRTFVGSVMLAEASRVCLWLGAVFGLVLDKFDAQVIVRMVLASANAAGLCLIRRAVGRRFGQLTGMMFALLSCTQFHLPFWMGRTLPNMFALLPANIALYLLIDRASNSTRPSRRSVTWSISLLTFTTVVLRSELLLLVGPTALQAALRYTSLYHVVKVGIIAGILSMAITIAVDSYFWQQWPLWPELYGIYFNVVQGKSSDWGVSPFHEYLSSSLPKLLLTSLPLSALGCVLDSRIRATMLPYLSFVALISGLAHKEWRFVIYVVPAFNVAAARAAAWLVGRPKGSLFGRLCFLAVPAMLLANCFATALLARSSFANYPGGSALYAFNQLFASEEHVHVHISNLAAQTGASLFLQTRSPPYLPGILPSSSAATQTWSYDKTENLSLDDLTASRNITHLIAEADSLAKLSSAYVRAAWTPVASVDGFDGWRLDLGGVRGGQGLAEKLEGLMGALEMRRSTQLAILKRAG